MKKIKDIVNKLTTDNRIESKIRVFNYVRDIPYHVSHNDNPIEAIEDAKANCGQKARLLDMLLTEIGEKTKKISARYKVQNLPIPQEIIDIWPSEYDYHLANLIKIRNDWILLDATGDINLKGTDYVVNEWDGVSNTKWYVKPEEFSYKGSGNEREFREKLDEWLKEMEKHKERADKFVKRENKYIKKVRKSNKKE
ncbi:MAG: hypothetical protein ABEK17_04385 [Candidatus Aenigmatarchaeota archaeon]